MPTHPCVIQRPLQRPPAISLRLARSGRYKPVAADQILTTARKAKAPSSMAVNCMLQNLISLARRQRDVLPRAAGASDPLGKSMNLLSKDEADAFHAQPDANHERRLSERFRQALKMLTEDSPTIAQAIARRRLAVVGA